MTSDDHGKAVNLKVGGKLYTDHGAVVSATPIDKAIGDRSFDYHTGTFSFVEGESIILCSDGLYGSSTFDEDIIFALSQVGLEESIGQLTTIAVQVQKQLPEGEARDNYYMLCNLLKDLLRIVFMRK